MNIAEALILFFSCMAVGAGYVLVLSLITSRASRNWRR